MPLRVGDYWQGHRRLEGACASMAETTTFIRAGSCTASRQRWWQWGVLCDVTAAALVTPFGLKIRDWRQRKNCITSAGRCAWGIGSLFIRA